jgi:hypothetical protein
LVIYYIYYNKPNQKGEARGFDPGTSSPLLRLNIHAQTNRPTTYIVMNAHKIYLNVESAKPWGGGTCVVRPWAHISMQVQSLIAGCRGAQKLRQISSWAWECQSRIEAWRQSFLGNSMPRIQWCCLFSDLSIISAA